MVQVARAGLPQVALMVACAAAALSDSEPACGVPAAEESKVCGLLHFTLCVVFVTLCALESTDQVRHEGSLPCAPGGRPGWLAALRQISTGRSVGCRPCAATQARVCATPTALGRRFGVDCEPDVSRTAGYSRKGSQSSSEASPTRRDRGRGACQWY